MFSPIIIKENSVTDMLLCEKKGRQWKPQTKYWVKKKRTKVNSRVVIGDYVKKSKYFTHSWIQMERIACSGYTSPKLYSWQFKY